MPIRKLSVAYGMLVAVVTSPFGRSVLVIGPESFLADRAVAAEVAAAKAANPEVTIAREDAADLNGGRLLEMTGTALFSSETVAVVGALESLPADLGDTLLALVRDLPDDVLLVLAHAGGAKGKPLADKLKKAVDEVVDAPAFKPWELAQFVITEARRMGGKFESAAAQALVDAVGHDARSLASAVDQLLSDVGGRAVTPVDVGRYFGGRAEVTAFAVAEDVLNGNQAAAVEKLRWTLATGGAHVLVTGALASSLRQLGKFLDSQSERRPEAALAKDIGVPPWKIKDIARQARSWDAPSVGRAIKAVAEADAAVKGAASDPDFALEKLLLQIAACRPAARRR